VAVVIRAVLFDVDFTLARPGPELMPEGYVSCAARHGLTIEAGRYEDARDAAFVDLQHHPELDHDEEVWVAFTERIVLGMGGTPPASRVVAEELTARWTQHGNFELYEDTLPALRALREHGVKIGLVSNSARDVREFARHHALEIDAGISSFHHGKTKPHASIFRAVLELLEVEPPEALMAGDSIDADIEGAQAIGMQAVLVDRLGLYPEFEPRIETLDELAVLVRADA
jgi:putative hydrolase of the HAD superfamily